MQFISTRGLSPAVSGPEAVLFGIAPDGGLYLPDTLPRLDGLLYGSMDYTELAATVFRALLPGFAGDALDKAARAAYMGPFFSPDVTPLVPVGDDFVLELFHGPTAAFKDLALQALPRLMASAVSELSPGMDTLVLAATSGDTGSAAMKGFQGIPGFRVLVYYPVEGVSAVQKAQMRTMAGSNVRAMGIRGDFDTAQAGVKAAFARADELPPGIRLSSANSINIGRLIPQIVYYIHACRELLRLGRLKPGGLADFIVPTGNFGDILAGYLAKKMRLPIGTLVCAANANRVLADFMGTGVYDARRALLPTLSPSMDILVSSNLERLLYLASNGDGELVRGLMADLKANGVYRADKALMRAIRRDFSAASVSDVGCLQAIRAVWDAHAYLMDPHTAAAWGAMSEMPENGRPRVVLATASPFKFPRAMFRALNLPEPMDEPALPEKLGELTGLPVPASLTGLDLLPVLHQDVIPGNAVADDALKRAASW